LVPNKGSKREIRRDFFENDSPPCGLVLPGGRQRALVLMVLLEPSLSTAETSIAELYALPESNTHTVRKKSRSQRKLLHSWIILVIVKELLVQIGRIDGPTEFLFHHLRRRWSKKGEHLAPSPPCPEAPFRVGAPSDPPPSGLPLGLQTALPCPEDPSRGPFLACPP